jgi:outer membrane protein assembly factor BamB
MKPKTHGLALAAAAGLLATWLALPCPAGNWPGFRGPGGQGVSQEQHLPLRWSLSENLAWQAEVPGLGWSSPIVWEGRVFVTSASPDGTSCHVVCLDTATGSNRWDTEVFTQNPPRKLAENSHATPTPVTDGRLVFAAFNGGRVVAVDFTGKIIWSWQDKDLSASTVWRRRRFSTATC